MKEQTSNNQHLALYEKATVMWAKGMHVFSLALLLMNTSEGLHHFLSMAMVIVVGQSCCLFLAGLAYKGLVSKQAPHPGDFDYFASKAQTYKKWFALPLRMYAVVSTVLLLCLFFF